MRATLSLVQPNALGVKRRLAATETHTATALPTARCRFNSLLDGPRTDAVRRGFPLARYGGYARLSRRPPAWCPHEQPGLGQRRVWVTPLRRPTTVPATPPPPPRLAFGAPLPCQAAARRR